MLTMQFNSNTEIQRYKPPRLRLAVCILLSHLCLATSCLFSIAYADLDIKGVDGQLLDNVLAHLQISQEPCDAPTWRLQQRRRDIHSQIKSALQAYGYYNPDIQRQFTTTEKCWQLDIAIEKGERVLFRDINVELKNNLGNIHPSLQNLITAPPIKSKEPLRHQAYDNYKTSIIDTARAWGYWQANFEKAELAVFPKDLVADVFLILNLGPRYHFGDYTFAETPLNKDLIVRLAKNVYGKPYSSEEIQESYSRLQSSDYFSQVLIQPVVDQSGENLGIPLSVDLSMNSKHSFGAGLGFSTDQGPRIRGDYRNRYFNAAGHKTRLDALWSVKLRQIAGTYTIPREDASEEWYELSGGYTEEETTSYERITLTTSVRAISALKHDWVMNTGLNILNERYIIGSDPIDQKFLIVPGLGFSWSSTDDTVRQTRGLRFETGFTTSNQAWQSDLNYIQAYTRTKAIWAPTHKARFITRLELAGTYMDDFTELPPSVRYFTGGDNSIRGYEYNSVGEINEQGEVIGGGKLAVASVEYDYLFLPNWSASTFFDSGDAFDGEADFKSAWGVGIRWYSPVGALRFDIALPQHSEEKYRLHISVGADL